MLYPESLFNLLNPVCFLTRFLARVLTRVLGRGKAINTVYSTTRPKETILKITKCTKKPSKPPAGPLGEDKRGSSVTWPPRSCRMLWGGPRPHAEFRVFDKHMYGSNGIFVFLSQCLHLRSYYLLFENTTRPSLTGPWAPNTPKKVLTNEGDEPPPQDTLLN